MIDVIYPLSQTVDSFPKNDVFVVVAIILCTILTTIAIANAKDVLWKQIKEFSTNREVSSIFETASIENSSYLSLLTTQFFLSSGVISYYILYYSNSEWVVKYSSWQIILSVGAIFLLYFIAKVTLYSYIGWIFFRGNIIDTWFKSYYTIIHALSIFLLPFLFATIYLNLSINTVLFTALGLLFLSKVLILYKLFNLFFKNIYTTLPLFLYFCALEIVPLLLLYKISGAN
ncbi:MAG: DUF4271 domain-containing protein [Bacteroides sp.]|nr:DUF4271 domain-containing protein [Bacteroides sp.]